MKIGTNPCNRRRDGKAPCSKHALAHATIEGLLAWYSGKSLPACPLHNRNHMVTTFGNSEWVTQSSGQVQSKSVTSCAGMTAHLVLLAQTRVGFLSGGRGKRMRELSPTECAAQLEEAYARATVALTRAQRLCLIMGPLDMKGLLGAATVIGCLKYGAGLCGFNPGQRDVSMHLRESDIGKGPDDAAFLLSLQRSISNDRGVYPPLAFAEIYRNDVSTKTRIRRLHLLVVDLERTKCVSDDVYWQFQKVQVSTCYSECFNTLPVPIADVESPVRCRYVYGYGVDASDRPSYLLWPRRGSDGHFWLMDPRSGKFFDISFHFIPFHSISFHFIPFHSISFHFIPFPFHSISFHFIPFQTDTVSSPQRHTLYGHKGEISSAHLFKHPSDLLPFCYTCTDGSLLRAEGPEDG